MKKKIELRNWAKNYRKTLNISDISEAIVCNIRKSEEYKSADNIMFFYPLPDEVNLLALLEDNKNFFLPRVNGADLEVCPYKYGDELKLSDLKINEPITKSVSPNELDIVFLPALCADNSFYRLGYGGGFYDRFCSGSDYVFKKYIVVPDELVIDTVPIEAYDIKCDGIITQKKASF